MLASFNYGLRSLDRWLMDLDVHACFELESFRKLRKLGEGLGSLNVELKVLIEGFKDFNYRLKAIDERILLPR